VSAEQSATARLIPTATKYESSIGVSTPISTQFALLAEHPALDLVAARQTTTLSYIGPT
jgi:hypothetical protein